MNEPSRKQVCVMIEEAKASGADSVILGCTEICMLVDDANSLLPAYDAARIHARALVDFSLS